MPHQFLGHPGKGRARHRCRDGGNARFVPPDARVDDGGTRRFDFFGKLHNLIMGGSIRDQIDHRQPIDQDEIIPNGRAGASDDLNCKTHAVFIRTAPAICAFVGVRDQKLVDEISL